MSWDHDRLERGPLGPTDWPVVYFDEATPQGLVRLRRQIVGEAAPGAEENAIGTPWDGAPITFSEQLDAYLDLLPGQDIVRACRVYRAFARSPIIGDRSWISASLPALTRVDNKTGLELWRQLITDPHPHVRSSTRMFLDMVVADTLPRPMLHHDNLPRARLLASVDERALMEQAGMTLDEVRELYRQFNKIEARERRLARVALINIQ